MENTLGRLKEDLQRDPGVLALDSFISEDRIIGKQIGGDAIVAILKQHPSSITFCFDLFTLPFQEIIL